MDATTVETIFTKAIEILGPAVIVAVSTYKVTMSQLEVKLRELDKKQEFGVREKLFNYYKDSLVSLNEGYVKLNNNLWQLLGGAVATDKITGIDNIDTQSSEMFITMFEIAEMDAKKVLLDIETVAMYLEQENLNDNEDYNRLKSYIDPLQKRETERTLQVLRKNTIIILEAYHILQRCHQILIGKQMEQIFKKYIDEY